MGLSLLFLCKQRIFRREGCIYWLHSLRLAFFILSAHQNLLEKLPLKVPISKPYSRTTKSGLYSCGLPPRPPTHTSFRNQTSKRSPCSTVRHNGLLKFLPTLPPLLGAHAPLAGPAPFSIHVTRALLSALPAWNPVSPQSPSQFHSLSPQSLSHAQSTEPFMYLHVILPPRPC